MNTVKKCYKSSVIVVVAVGTVFVTSVFAHEHSLVEDCYTFVESVALMLKFLNLHFKRNSNELGLLKVMVDVTISAKCEWI